MTRKEAMRQTHQMDVLIGLGFTQAESEQLRRISMTLQRWHELECGTDAGCIERGRMVRNAETGKREFVSDENGAPFMGNHDGDRPRYWAIPDRETGARKRLAAIIAARNKREWHPIIPEPVSSYIQGDPRGAALYIIRPGDVPAGQTVDSCYSRGICVY